MKMAAESKGRRASWCYVIAALWAAACGGALGQTTVGGESHFLRHCGDGCGESLECIADVCTRSCRIDDAGACNDLASTARCTNTSIEPGVIAVCDQACAGNADCSARGAGFSCEAGYCRGPALSGSPNPPEPVGDAGQSSGGTPMSTGGTPVSTGGTPMLPSGGTGAAGMGGSSAGAGGSGPPLPAACSLPFEGGECDGSIPVFAFVDGACRRATYGGCGGNENRFYSIEECESVCELRPSANPCNDGLIDREICLGCGPAGGCSERLRVCAQPCDAESACASSSFHGCFDGVCQVGGCF
jgi:hypothetical protein